MHRASAEVSLLERAMPQTNDELGNCLEEYFRKILTQEASCFAVDVATGPPLFVSLHATEPA